MLFQSLIYSLLIQVQLYRNRRLQLYSSIKYFKRVLRRRTIFRFGRATSENVFRTLNLYRCLN